MLRIRKSAMTAIEAHMRETYPHECCGLIIGSAYGEVREGRRSAPCGNLNTERAADRYELDPRDMLRIQQELEGTSHDIVGVYHSHPDHPSRASETDREHAWPGWSYMIGSVVEGEVASVQSWVLDASGERFEEEPVAVDPDGGESEED